MLQKLMSVKCLCGVDDFKQAFDIVWRNGIYEKWFNCIRNMFIVYGSLIKDKYKWCILELLNLSAVRLEYDKANLTPLLISVHVHTCINDLEYILKIFFSLVFSLNICTFFHFFSPFVWFILYLWHQLIIVNPIHMYLIYTTNK